MKCLKCHSQMTENFEEVLEPIKTGQPIQNGDIRIISLIIWACNCGALYHQTKEIRVSEVLNEKM